MTRLKITFAVLALLVPGPLPAEPNWSLCLGIENNDARLSCYDAQATGTVSTKFEGFGGQDLPVIDTVAGDVLVYRNRDVVMVVSVLSEAGELVQNLHIGGAGVKRHEFSEDGAYQIQVDATGAWAIWIEPRIAGAP